MRISKILENFVTEDIDSNCSLDSKLSFMPLCSFRNRSRKRDIEQRVKLNFKASSKFAEYELWWPEQKRWLLKHHWLLDKYSIQADAKLLFTNRNKVLKGNRILTRSLTKTPTERIDMRNSS